MKILKLSILVIAIVLMSCNNERSSFEIKGTISGIDETTRIVLITAAKDTLAETSLVDGKFSITGTVSEPTETYLTYGRPYTPITLENELYEVSLDAKDRSKSVLTGGKLNTLINAYKEYPEFVKASGDLKSLMKDYENIDQNDKEAVADFMKVYQEKSKVSSDITVTYFKGIIEGQNAPLEKFFALKNMRGGDYTYDDKIDLVTSFKEVYGEFKGFDDFIAIMENAKKTEAMSKTVTKGSDYKEVIASTVAGEQIKLSEIIAQNEYTLLEMWASWCGPCRGEFPHLKKAYSHYKEKGFEIYGLSVDDNKEKWLKACEEEDIPWISVVDYAAFKSEAIMNYGVRGIPSSFLISKEGKIVASMGEVRGNNLDEKLEELLGK